MCVKMTVCKKVHSAHKNEKFHSNTLLSDHSTQGDYLKSAGESSLAKNRQNICLQKCASVAPNLGNNSVNSRIVHASTRSHTASRPEQGFTIPCENRFDKLRVDDCPTFGENWANNVNDKNKAICSHHISRTINTSEVTTVGKTCKFKNHTMSVDVDDKYSLSLHIKPKQAEILKSAAGNSTYEKWRKQTDQKYGFIPLANQKLPIFDKNRHLNLDPLQVHNIVKGSGTHNYMHEQILVKSELKVKTWEKFSKNYWD